MGACDERDLRKEIERIFRIGRVVFGLLQQRRRWRSLEPANVDELLGVDGAIENVETGNESVAEAANDPVIGNFGETSVVLVAIVEPLENRMH